MDKPVDTSSPPRTGEPPSRPPLIRDLDPATDPDLWRGSAPPDPAAWTTPTVTNHDPWGTDIGLTTAVRTPRASWTPNRRTTAILAVMLVALLALIAAVVILMTREPSARDNPAPAPPTSTSPTATTTPVTSAPPPPPPPPPPSEEPPPAQPNYPRTYYPRTPSPERPNVTTPQTRGPDISVRPSHRPAFPGQPGEN